MYRRTTWTKAFAVSRVAKVSFSEVAQAKKIQIKEARQFDRFKYKK